jgi:Domain of unknown function (DUF4258)
LILFDLSQVKVCAQNDRIAFKRHAVIRMQQRGIQADDVKSMLLAAEVVEEYAQDHPLPSALLLGSTPTQSPLHAVVALDPSENGMLWVITVYEPDLQNWDSDLRTRRCSNVVSIV